MFVKSLNSSSPGRDHRRPHDVVVLVDPDDRRHVRDAEELAQQVLAVVEHRERRLSGPRRRPTPWPPPRCRPSRPTRCRGPRGAAPRPAAATPGGRSGTRTRTPTSPRASCACPSDENRNVPPSMSGSSKSGASSDSIAAARSAAGTPIATTASSGVDRPPGAAGPPRTRRRRSRRRPPAPSRSRTGTQTDPRQSPSGFSTQPVAARAPPDPPGPRSPSIRASTSTCAVLRIDHGHLGGSHASNLRSPRL